MKKILSTLSLCCILAATEGMRDADASITDNISGSRRSSDSSTAGRRMPEFANAITDTGFKQLMSDNNVAMAILNSVVPDFQLNPITSIESITVAIPPLKEGMEKQTFMDYHVITQAGEHVIVEMQARRHVLFDERAVFYLASTFAGQIKGEMFKQRDWYKNLKRVYAIQFVDYDSSRISGIGIADSMVTRVQQHPMRRDQYVKHYMLTDKYSGQTIDCIQMIQIELPRAANIQRLQPENCANFIGAADWWLSLLKYSEQYTDRQLATAPLDVMGGFSRLRYSAWNSTLQKEYKEEFVPRELYSEVLDAERQQGIEQGIEQGRIITREFDKFRKLGKKYRVHIDMKRNTLDTLGQVLQKDRTKHPESVKKFIKAFEEAMLREDFTHTESSSSQGIME